MSDKVYIHIHIPKTAGCFIRELCKKSLNNKIFYPFNHIDTLNIEENKKPFPYEIKYHYNISILEKCVPSVNSPKVQLFSVVRNPYDRIYSLWKHCRKSIENKSSQMFEVPTSFEKFVYELYENRYLNQYLAQSQLFYLDRMENYDIKLFKFEEMDKIKNFLISDCNLVWDNKKINETPGLPYKSMYTLEMVEMIKTKFKQEFEVFSYSTDL